MFTRKAWLPDDLLVRAPRLYGRRTIAAMVIRVVLGLASIAVLGGAPDGAWYRSLIAAPILGITVAWSGLAPARRIIAYRNGWIDGRSVMIGALVETQKRGLTPEDWLQAQAEADAALLGIPAPRFEAEEN